MRELTRGHVQLHLEGLVGVGVLPLARLHADGLHHPRAGWDNEATVLEVLDEVTRVEEPAFRVLPANERLDPDHRRVVDGHDRLVVQHELLGVDGFSKFLVLTQSAAAAIVLPAAVHDHGLPVALLLGVQLATSGLRRHALGKERLQLAGGGVEQPHFDHVILQEVVR